MRLAFLLIALAACPSSSGPASPKGQGHPDGAAYQTCNTLCLRPSDCLLAYNDDGLCPAGFLCASSFTCPSPTPSP